nr:hypothetical protein [Angustibacter aerolatus]
MTHPLHVTRGSDGPLGVLPLATSGVDRAGEQRDEQAAGTAAGRPGHAGARGGVRPHARTARRRARPALAAARRRRPRPARGVPGARRRGGHRPGGRRGRRTGRRLGGAARARPAARPARRRPAHGGRRGDELARHAPPLPAVRAPPCPCSLAGCVGARPTAATTTRAPTRR